MNFNSVLAYSVLLALPLTANATKPPVVPPKAEASAEASSQAEASSEANSASQSVSEANNSLAVNQVRQAPSMAAPSVFPTADCLSGLSGAVSMKGFGLAFGGNKAIKECQIVVLSQNYAALGLTEAACQALNSTETAKAVFGEAMPSCAPKPVVCEAPKCVTQDDLANRWEEVNKRVEKALSK